MWWIRAMLVVLALVLAGSMPGAIAPTLAQQSCSTASARFDAARQAGSPEQAIGIYAELAEAATGCSTQVVHCAGNAIALDLLAQSYAAQDRGGEAAEITSLLERASDFGTPWQLQVALADLEFHRGRTRKDGQAFEQAALLYQDALNQLSDPPVCAGPDAGPTEEEIMPIYNRMTEALLLAPEFTVARTRSGKCGGVFLARVRGFTPRFRPIPINFVFAEASFTESGAVAADILLNCLKESNGGSIVLSGHTDPIGSDAFNLELSAQRLERVAAYLREGGYEGEIKLLPKGEAEPFEPDDPLGYGEEELNQLNRRVVLRDWQQ